MISIFNSLTKKKEILAPIKKGEVGLYVCGMTVYDYCHIGHARSWVVFDVIVRYLQNRGFKVSYVKNITDIDDKIINRANENKEDWSQLTKRFIKAYQEDEEALGCLPPTNQPCATEYIPQIIQLIQKLIDNQHAYVGDNGDIYFDVRHFEKYGQLSHRNIDQLQTGVRIEINENKRDPLDFVLWKLSKPGEPEWDSPFGAGRPGWHIECSAMAATLLGQPFDLHGGGLDLKFPHHENEIAQSEAAENKPFVKTWIHVGLLNVNAEKMSKSLGNMILVRDALKEYGAELLRYFFLSSHYRSPLSFSSENLIQLRSALERLYLSIRGLNLQTAYSPSHYSQRFHEMMEDDFNTPEVFALFFEMAHEINRFKNESQEKSATLIAVELKYLGGLLGILQVDPESFLKEGNDKSEHQAIEALIKARNEARAKKDWTEADRIRDQLKAMSILIEDTATGTTWRKAQGTS